VAVLSQGRRTMHKSPFTEGLLVIERDSWLQSVTGSALATNGYSFLQISAGSPLAENWKRFRNAPFIIVHWENPKKCGGAFIESILETDDSEDPTNRIIVVTTDPMHEDVVYFGELGLWRIIRVRNRDQDANRSRSELKLHLHEINTPTNNIDSAWRKLRNSIERLTNDRDYAVESKIRHDLEHLPLLSDDSSARRFEAKAAFSLKLGDIDKAQAFAIKAIECNPNFLRAWSTLVIAKTKEGEHEQAYGLLQKMQLRNRRYLKRLTMMGYQLMALGDIEKAEIFFRHTLERDHHQAAALNGLAEINFFKNNLDDAKKLLSKSSKASDFASKLNQKGIAMVKQKNYQAALTHYTKAQYVLPDASKSHKIYYNMALAHAKSENKETAKHFLKLALIKNPNFDRAKILLARLEKSPNILDQWVSHALAVTPDHDAEDTPVDF
jgi:tetratricopeptide (TPR) repeat protein